MSVPQIYLLHKRCTSTHASVLEMCHLVCQTLRFCFPGFFLLSLCFQSSLVVSKEEQDVTLIDGLIGDAHMQLHPYKIIHMVCFACIFFSIPNIVQWLCRAGVTCFLRLLRCCCNVAIQSAMLFTNF